MSTAFNDAPTPTSIVQAPAQVKGGPPGQQGTSETKLAGWVMSRVSRWRLVRNSAYLERWNEYYRLWRGIWDSGDKTRMSERSRIITPALAEAVDLIHAEITEAVFGRDRWFDIADDLTDAQKGDAEANRDQLAEDMHSSGVEDSIIKAIQIGCLYGTGAVKVSTEVKTVRDYARGPDGAIKPTESQQAVVNVYPVDPRELVPDPGASTIDEMLGIAHETYVPQHDVFEKQASGFYMDAYIMGATQGATDRLPKGVLSSAPAIEEVIFLTEYHGKVPTKYMMAMDPNAPPVPDDMDESDLTEAIVTVGNERTLLRAVRNPFWMQDRSIVAYQHESVPGEFWGRGVAEKGYNPQKALDAEVRMRIDALALVAAPMIATDKTRLPRGFDMRTWPGKNWPTVGNPDEVIRPVNFGNLNPATFDQGSHLEQMVKQATGAMDPGTALSQGSRRDTMGGTAMMSAGMVKRSKRTMYNIENQLLDPLIQKILWRYLQFSPDKYKTDTKFNVRGAMGIMAREFEQGVLSQLYAATPPDSPSHLLILREIFDMSSSPHKQQLVDSINKQLTPDPKKQQMQEQMEGLAFQKAILEVQAMKAKIALDSTGAQKNAAIADATSKEADFQEGQLLHDAMRVKLEGDQMGVLQGQTALIAQGNVIKAGQLKINAEKLALEKRKVANGTSGA